MQQREPLDLDSRGIEPRTTPMLREYYTTKPQAQLIGGEVPNKYITIGKCYNAGGSLGFPGGPQSRWCGPEQSLGPNIYTAAATIGRSDCPYDLLAEWSNALM
ncbi:hypothetical protein ACN38_g479 [Penicillium nordicum]|uniref:Uncharacterized protein n=1 Tax=Penicillium nordicum TaxID=229535 RepID=A0A0M8PH25_9EURO|nr:hypothetical protein ACN38_g479 [Penicillium nordicum]